MPKSPQDIYARHLLSPRGYPLWTPEPSHQLLAYRRDGLRIGDVGIVIPEDGCFDVFFNLCLPSDHPFHQATGVPDNFKPIRLSDMDLRTIVNAESPGRIIATSAVTTVNVAEGSGDTSSRTRSSGLEYEFNLSSSEGALLILPEGAERQDLRNYHVFLEAATRHGADWYRFAEEKVGQILSHDSLYLITGLHKTLSWSLAAFEKTVGSGEYPAQCRLPQLGGGNTTATCTWNTSRALDWRVGPIDNYGIPNQAVFIRGFKIARRTGVFGTRWISVKTDAPSTRPNHINYFGAVPGDSWLGYIFGSQPAGRNIGTSRGGVQDDVVTDPALDAARNEIQNHGALAVGEDVVIHRVPEASQAFHPSDIINQYLLSKEPSANIAITHDDEWIVLLEKNMLRPEDLIQGDPLKTLVFKHHDVISEEGAVYLRSRSAQTTETPGHDSDIMSEISSTQLGDMTTSRPLQDISVQPNSSRIVESSSSVTSNHPQDAVDVTGPAILLHEGTISEQKMDVIQHRRSPTTVGDQTTQSTSSTSACLVTKTSPKPSPSLPNAPDEVDPEPVVQREKGRATTEITMRVPPPELIFAQYAGGAVKLHSLLRASPNERGEYPSWVMCFRAHQGHFKMASAESWLMALTSPATQPYLAGITIVSRSFPGEIRAWAGIQGQAVTCEDVLDAIFKFLDDDMEWEEYVRFSRERFKTIAKPGDILKRSHWLGSNWFFGGLIANDAFVKERCGEESPSCFELICLNGIAYQ